MKKTYNVISRNIVKFSAMFCFTLFFLGMSSSASAQLATSRAAAGSMADFDYSITQKATIGVSDEVALEILGAELEDVREESQSTNLTPQEEAETSARLTFLSTAIQSYNDRGLELQPSLVAGHKQMASQVSRYADHIQQVVDFQGIVREYVERLK